MESLESLALVFDYLPNGNAFELFFENVTKISAAQRLKIAVQLVSGALPSFSLLMGNNLQTEVVTYLHQCRPIVIHRDIKTPNLVLDKNYNVKLCDFGKTKFMVFIIAYLGTTHYSTELSSCLKTMAVRRAIWLPNVSYPMEL